MLRMRTSKDSPLKWKSGSAAQAHKEGQPAQVQVSFCCACAPARSARACASYALMRMRNDNAGIVRRLTISLRVSSNNSGCSHAQV